MDQKHQPWAAAAMAMDIEKQASHPREATELDAIASAVGEEGRRSSRAADVLWVAVYGLVAVCTIAFSLWLLTTDRDPNYTLAVAAVSGLDPSTFIGGRPTLDPEFKFTVGIVQRNVLGPPRCDEFTTTLKVAYHGYELASATAPQLCDLGRDGMKTTTIVVRGTRVSLPGPVLDGLAADLRRVAGVLDVTLAIRLHYPTARHGYGLLVSCMGRRVGDAAGALCDVGDLQL